MTPRHYFSTYADVRPGCWTFLRIQTYRYMRRKATCRNTHRHDVTARILRMLVNVGRRLIIALLLNNKHATRKKNKACPLTFFSKLTTQIHKQDWCYFTAFHHCNTDIGLTENHVDVGLTFYPHHMLFHGRVMHCQRMSSLRPPVCLSVCLLSPE